MVFRASSALPAIVAAVAVGRTCPTTTAVVSAATAIPIQRADFMAVRMIAVPGSLRQAKTEPRDYGTAGGAAGSRKAAGNIDLCTALAIFVAAPD